MLPKELNKVVAKTQYVVERKAMGKKAQATCCKNRGEGRGNIFFCTRKS